MAEQERRPLNLVRTNETQISGQVPASLLWLNAVNPILITPCTWKSGGMSHIIFRTPDGTAVVNVYRTVSRYVDGATGVQDETHPFHENLGAQYNFEIDKDGNLVKYSDNPAFSERMQGCVDLVQPLVLQRGSTIIAISREGGVEARFESDGTQWIDSQNMPKLPSPSLSSAE